MKLLFGVLVIISGSFGAPNNGRIIGGGDAERGEFPYMVSLQYCSPVCSHTCGGAIISPSWILSAAHCITELTDTEKKYIAVAGILNLTDSNSERQEVNVSKTIPHPDYKGGINPHDVGLFKLAMPIEYTDLVQSIALPEQDKVYDGIVSFSGWGVFNIILGMFPEYPDTLQSVDVPLVSFEECKKILDDIIKDTPHPMDDQGNICTGPLTGGVSACSGDSGGPLVQNGTIVGIDSWGISSCRTDGAPSVFTKTSHYIEWIKENVDEVLLFN